MEGIGGRINLRCLPAICLDRMRKTKGFEAVTPRLQVRSSTASFGLARSLCVHRVLLQKHLHDCRYFHIGTDQENNW